MECYLCGNKEHELLSEKIRYNAPRKVWKCENCSLVFLHPQMTHEEEEEFYKKEYGEIFSVEKGTTPANLFEARMPDAKTYYKLVKNHLSKDDDCLELGAAAGSFLAVIKDKVKSVTGVEPHNLLRRFCEERNLKMVSSIDELGDKKFDRIFMFFLLEHLGDPIGHLKKVKNMLQNGGKLFIEVPNVDDALLSAYNIPKFREFYFTPAHQFYYSKKTLTTIVKKSGFDKFKIKYLQRYEYSNHIYWMIEGKPGGIGRYNRIFSKKLLLEYVKSLIEHGVSDTLFAIVTKQNKPEEGPS